MADDDLVFIAVEDVERLDVIRIEEDEEFVVVLATQEDRDDTWICLLLSDEPDVPTVFDHSEFVEFRFSNAEDDESIAAYVAEWEGRENG